MAEKQYTIVSDGSCDIPDQLVEKYGVTVVPFYVSFDEKNYFKEKEEIGVREFYQRMVDNKEVFPKSSLPSVQDYIDTFEPLVKEDIAIICICITTKFSGSMQSAVNARNLLLEKYPNAEITVIDSVLNTTVQGLFVIEAAKMCRKNIPYDEAVKRLKEIRDTGRIFFTVGSIDYLKHGGRIGKLTGLAVSALGLKPIITMKQGEIFPSGVSRGRKRSMDRVIELLLEYLEENHATPKEFRINIGYGYDYEEAVKFQKAARKVLWDKYQEKMELPLFQIGATVAVHTGPYPIGFGVIRRI